jgi:sugar phosphate isomerase/epimerase
MLTADSIALALRPLAEHGEPVTAARMRTLFDAAAGAGFSGVEYWINHYDAAVADGMSPDEFFGYPRDLGLSLVGTEMIASPAWETPDRQAITEATAHVLEVAERSGAPTVLAVARAFPDVDAALTGLGILCDLAADRGLDVSLEMVPFGGVTTIATAKRVLEQVDRDNLGLCFDMWHWYRQPDGLDFETLKSIPGERIHLIQLDDASPTPAEDLLVETMSARLLPGEGAADVPGVLAVLDEMGASPAIVSEVFSKELGALDPAENARRQFAAAQAVLQPRTARS